MDATTLTTSITIPQIDLQLLKDLAKKFGWKLDLGKKSGIDEALEDVKAGRVFHAESVHELLEDCLK